MNGERSASGGERLGSLVLLSSVHWHFTWQRHQELAARLGADGWNVVFVEPLPKRWPGVREWRRVVARLAGRAQLAGGCPQPSKSGVTVHAPRLLPDVGPLARRVNRRWRAPAIARRLAALAPERPRVVWSFLPLAVALAVQRHLEPDLAVYDCVWDWSNDPYSSPAALAEEDVIAAADLVLADAPYLYERLRQRHANVHRVLPAVDYDAWEPARAGGGSGGSPPRCAYFGALGANLDLALLSRVSRELPTRLIGPVQESLPQLGPGTEVLGPVDHERLPALLADVDVLMLPYREAGHTRGVIPAKTFECLATGLPTVAKGLPSLEELGDLFRLCTTEEEFLAALAAGPGGAADRQRRLDAARSNDWRQRTAEIEQLLAQSLAAGGGG